MSEQYKIAIIGSGPAGLSAAGHAAKLGISHILFEKTDHLSDTIYKYQKGKLVMATPDILPLRSDCSFELGLREEVLGAWDRENEELKVNTRFNADVTAISGEKGNFEITVGGETITAEYVILAIGLQGNLRQIGCPGSDGAPHVQYQLDDPDEYEVETIIVIGAGDAAIENAVALAKGNQVIIVNRKGEFARAKDGNLSLIRDSIEKGVLSCMYSASPVRVDPGSITLTTPEGEVEVKCDRIIARLGAIAPRQFVEACGVEFPSKAPTALPEVSATYESNVPGLYIIGALGGYPLIKQAMNQGYEAVEYIEGNEIKPADEPLLEERFAVLGDVEVADVLALIRENIPMFSELNALLLRELMIEATIHRPKAGDVVFARNDYTNSFFTVVDGEVAIEIDPEDSSKVVTLGQGQFFGEMGLLSGRRRTATVRAHSESILLEVPRRTMLKLISSVESVKRVIDQTAIVRQINTFLAPDATAEDLAEVLETGSIEHFKPEEVLFNEGDEADSLHLIRKGSVTVSKRIGGKEVVVAYVPAGHYVGEIALLSDSPRTATIRATVATETIKMDGGAFKRLLARNAALKTEVEKRLGERLIESERMSQHSDAGGIIEFLIAQGIGEATDVLLIDESLCVRCDNCEKACAETHGGISRLDREAGPTFANLHVPTSCRHCEHPHCMADCPPDAIHRAPNGEVFINDSCIGCGNCERNCPYGVIQLSAKPLAKPSLMSWLLFGSGPGPGQDKSIKAEGAKKGSNAICARVSKAARPVFGPARRGPPFGCGRMNFCRR